MGRAHRLVTAVWTVVAAGAGLGFLARDLLVLSDAAVAAAWVAGAVAGGLLARGAWRSGADAGAAARERQQ
jgi:hypothetical protein